MTTQQIQSHQARPLSGELWELYEIAKREHGPEARSTKRIRDALEKVDTPAGDGRELSSALSRGRNSILRDGWR